MVLSFVNNSFTFLFTIIIFLNLSCLTVLPRIVVIIKTSIYVSQTKTLALSDCGAGLPAVFLYTHHQWPKGPVQSLPVFQLQQSASALEHCKWAKASSRWMGCPWPSAHTAKQVTGTCFISAQWAIPCWTACWCEGCWSPVAQIYAKQQFVYKALEAYYLSMWIRLKEVRENTHSVWPYPVGTWSPSLLIWKVPRP